ncbi:MAG TPA: tetratricopeptide repeat protein [Thermoanaerobaculia bacterium]|nr:tetratricopeptide repeat protein [Thermoanaerobaculia bacterium]
MAATEAGIGPFEAAFAEGLWAFSQYDHVRAQEYFQEALRHRPGDGLTRYLLGLSYLRVGKPQVALKEIEASLTAASPPPLERSRVLVDLGAAQLATGNARAAVATLEKALRDREKDAVARYHYAKALEEVGRREDADAERGKARTDDPSLDPDNLPVTTPQVAGIGEQSRPWSGSLRLMADYDSNPNLLSEDLSLPIPPRNEVVDGQSADRTADTLFQLSYWPERLPVGWSLEINFRGGGSFHQDFDYLDLVRTGGTVQLGWERSERWSLILQSGAEQIRLDGSPYLRMIDAGASVLFSPSAAATTRFEVLFLDRGYSDHDLADPRREGKEVRVGLRQIRYLGDQSRYVSVGIAAADRSADPEFERTLWEGEVHAALPMGSRWMLGLSGRVLEEDFGDSASNLFNPRGPARSDQTWSASATVSYSITETIQAQVRGLYAERSSNVDMGEGLPDLDYRRTVLGTGVVWTF